MTPSRRTALAGFVVGIALVQVFLEDLLLFAATTGTLPANVSGSPAVLVAVPLAISLSLLTVLVGAALVHSDQFR